MDPSATPKSVSIDPSGITVRRRLTMSEVVHNLLYALGAVIGIGFWFIPGWLWAMVPAEHLEFVAEILSYFVLATPFLIIMGVVALWRFATQPTLRLTAHQVVLAPRWIPWDEPVRFPLADMDVRGAIEGWEGDQQWSVVHLTDGPRESRFRIQLADGKDAEPAREDLEWVLDRIRSAQSKQPDAGSRVEMVASLAPLRRRARDE